MYPSNSTEKAHMYQVLCCSFRPSAFITYFNIAEMLCCAQDVRSSAQIRRWFGHLEVVKTKTLMSCAFHSLHVVGNSACELFLQFRKSRQTWDGLPIAVILESILLVHDKPTDALTCTVQSWFDIDLTTMSNFTQCSRSESNPHQLGSDVEFPNSLSFVLKSQTCAPLRVYLGGLTPWPTTNTVKTAIVGHPLHSNNFHKARDARESNFLPCD